ncbi:hypothetical protein DESUT3_36290 [Desulfuromonas versatilis]|uniref:Nitrous oxide reductase accessory protein NosL n=1 Tax=Desulfuromonas versatilis TaxID=2802975 RepID=A0ABN6E2I5_9BACT|nr:nitrous oxide reductase accessory protein NosL [Desulfuromonas versatilis]BCR06560.1 hypothetical protein DESUT3_36290 [Desulfuromonas versatilis]
MNVKLIPGLALALLLSATLLTPVSAEEAISPGPGDRCPVCGMFVAPHPNWVTAIAFKDGSRVFFDGPKDMIRYYLSFADYNKTRTLEDVAGVFVTEYYSTRQMAAEEVFFVLGSDVMGPMGKELIPIAGREAAETFLRDHRGEKITTFAEIVGPGVPQSR